MVLYSVVRDRNTLQLCHHLLFNHMPNQDLCRWHDERLCNGMRLHVFGHQESNFIGWFHNSCPLLVDLATDHYTERIKGNQWYASNRKVLITGWLSWKALITCWPNIGNGTN
uniref:Uncharacterized protein n=1 Tax=Octopus bimaculoides TaxID=37653 RepID=A0A0L8GIY2_OCTBM